MRSLTYEGPHESVRVGSQVVARGDTVELDADLADGLSKAGGWVEKPKPKKAADKAGKDSER